MLLLVGAAVLAVSAVSLWNILGLSLPLPSPSTSLTSVPLHRGEVADIATLATGGLHWTFETGGQPIVTSPVVVGGMAYLAVGRDTATGRIVALNVESGKLMWERELESIPDYPPAVAGDLLYVGTRSGRILAVNRHTGEDMWSFEAGSWILGTPVVQNGVLYLGAEQVYALDAATGKERWRRPVGGGVARP
ncbi:MAG: PQQ-binding-like beta-propeller repeat protein, partial [Chloroflexota bacterium]|nr:PQQ-binding-like beta-propeller repeat protein [Chloroflexota bacterium]